MNRYDFDAEKAPNGWHAWHQRVHEAKKTYAMFKGEPILFGSELEALRVAREMHLNYLSLPISGTAPGDDYSPRQLAKSQALKMFKTKNEVAA